MIVSIHTVPGVLRKTLYPGQKEAWHSEFSANL